MRAAWIAVIAAACGGSETPAHLDASASDALIDASVDAVLADSPLDAMQLPTHAYLKASNADQGDRFGVVAISGDGTTLVVGASSERSNATTVDGDQADNSFDFGGAAYVFVRRPTGWAQQAYLKPFNMAPSLSFGGVVAISDDGDTVVVGATGESSGAITSGAAYVFVRTGTTWSFQGFLKASHPDLYDGFGQSLAVSASGDVVVVGAPGDDSASTSIDGDEADDARENAGAAYVFARTGTTWTQHAYLKAAISERAHFGSSVAMTPNGAMIVVGAERQGGGVGFGGSGGCYVFRRAGQTWTRDDGVIKASNGDANDRFGIDVAISADGTVLVVGAEGEASASVSTPADNSGASTGAAYVFRHTAGSWTEEAYLKHPSPDAGDYFGEDVGISAAGDRVVVGASYEDGSGTTTMADPADDGADKAGAAIQYRRVGGAWMLERYLKAPNTDAGDNFGGRISGRCLSVSSDGMTIAAGALNEDGGARGVDGDETSNAASDSGAVYIFPWEP